MKKTLNIEKRKRKSKRQHYNNPAGWLPRLIIWPEFDDLIKESLEVERGVVLDNETVNEWGLILNKTFSKFLEKYKLEYLSLKRFLKLSILKLKRKYQWIETKVVRNWEGRKYQIKLEKEYINFRQEEGHDVVNFIIYQKPKTQNDLIAQLDENKFLNKKWLEKNNILKCAVGLFSFGIEEAVLEVCLAEYENRFIEILTKIAETYGYQVEKSPQPFLSHWVIANKEKYIKKYGVKWNVF